MNTETIEQSISDKLLIATAEVLGFTNLTANPFGDGYIELFGLAPAGMIDDDSEGFRVSVPKFITDMSAIWIGLRYLKDKFNNGFEFELLSDWDNSVPKNMIFGITMFLSGRRVSIWEISMDLVPTAFSILLCSLSNKNISEFEKEFNLKVQDINFKK